MSVNHEVTHVAARASDYIGNMLSEEILSWALKVRAKFLLQCSSRYCVHVHVMLLPMQLVTVAEGAHGNCGQNANSTVSYLKQWNKAALNEAILSSDMTQNSYGHFDAQFRAVCLTHVRRYPVSSSMPHALILQYAVAGPCTVSCLWRVSFVYLYVYFTSELAMHTALCGSGPGRHRSWVTMPRQTDVCSYHAKVHGAGKIPRHDASASA